MKLMFIRNRNVLNTKWLVQYINCLQEARPDYDITVVCDTYKKLGNELTFNPKVKLINLSGKTDNPITNLYHKVRCKITPACFRYKKIIKKEKPDVIICYFPKDLFNVTLFQKHNIPIVMMIHGTPQMIVGKYQYAPLDENHKNIRKEILPLRMWHHGCFSQITVWQTLLSSFIPMIEKEFSPKKAVTIPNMVQQIDPKDYVDLSIEKKKIVYVARIEQNMKRQHLLAEAFGKIAKDFPGWTVEFWGIQKFPQYEAEIVNIARRYNVEDRVIIKGYTTDILSVYKSADIHAFPSKYEGFSLAIADGQAIGLPTIGFAKSPSVNEMIIDKHNGFLASDLDDFADKLAELMRNKDLRIEMGKNAIEDTKAYAPNNVIAMWTKLFDDIAKQ